MGSAKKNVNVIAMLVWHDMLQLQELVTNFWLGGWPWLATCRHVVMVTGSTMALPASGSSLLMLCSILAGDGHSY